jgi:hypothetical protein
MTADEYVRAIAQRLESDGAEIDSKNLPAGFVLIGYRSQFRLRWVASKLNLFTIVAQAEVGTVDRLEHHTDEALSYATSQKGRFRGLQNGVAAIPALVASTVEPEAITFASTHLTRKFSAFAWPVLVDLASEKIYRHQGTVFLGGIYANWIRHRIDATFPAFHDPHEFGSSMS